NHVQVLLLDQPVEVDVDEIEPGRRAPMAEQAGLDVRLLQRPPQQRIAHQINLADGEIIRRAPVRVHFVQQVGVEACFPVGMRRARPFHAGTRRDHAARNGGSGTVQLVAGAPAAFLDWRNHTRTPVSVVDDGEKPSAPACASARADCVRQSSSSVRMMRTQTLLAGVLITGAADSLAAASSCRPRKSKPAQIRARMGAAFSPMPAEKTSVSRPLSTAAYAPIHLRACWQKRATASAARGSWSSFASRSRISGLISETPSSPHWPFTICPNCSALIRSRRAR